MVYCVGLTGGLATGKSTVAELFSHLGIQIISADKISRELTAKNQAAYDKIIARYGQDLLDENQELKRANLRGIIFSDPLERNWLENLLHPLIRQRISELVKASITPYCMVEIPLLIDKKNYPYLNKILLVTAPLATQIARVMQRDQCSKQEALAILAAQPDIALRQVHADDVIVNNQGLEELKISVNTLHQHYLLHK
jgi:dephospho-CoA kinase